jgi:hypothetical protein
MTAFKLHRALVRFETVTCLALLAACSAQSPAEPGAASPAQETAPPPAADEAAAESAAPRTSGVSIFAVHQVRDFDAFLKFIEEGSAARAEAGVEGYLLSRLDDGRVAIHFFAKSVEQVEAALQSKEMDQYLDREGAAESSLIWLAKDELVFFPKAPPAGETFSLYMKLKVSDFAAFKKAFAEQRAAFAEQSVIAEGLHRSTADDNTAILHFVGTSRALLEALPKSAAFTELLALGGTQEPPKPILAVDVARNRPE